MPIRCLVGAIAVLGLAFAVSAASGATQASQRLTVYAVPTTVQFMNHADDRLRGMSTNFSAGSSVAVGGSLAPTRDQTSCRI